jgi:hypothetical protein
MSESGRGASPAARAGPASGRSPGETAAGGRSFFAHPVRLLHCDILSGVLWFGFWAIGLCRGDLPTAARGYFWFGKGCRGDLRSPVGVLNFFWIGKGKYEEGENI